METGILAGIVAAFAPLLWTLYEYLKLKNRTLLWDKLKEYQNEKNRLDNKIDGARVDSSEYGGLCEYRAAVRLIIADISARLSISATGNADSDDKGDIQPPV